MQRVAVKEEEEDLEMKCCGDEDEDEIEIEKEKEGARRERFIGGGGVLGKLKKTEQKGENKGHVRWTSSVDTVGLEEGKRRRERGNGV